VYHNFGKLTIEKIFLLKINLFADLYCDFGIVIEAKALFQHHLL